MQIAVRFDDFDGNGLRHDINHLNRMNIPQMITWDLKKQSEYVDVITHNGYDNMEALAEQDKMITSAEVLRMAKRGEINATAIGNLAYVALYSPAPYNEKAKQYLSLLKGYYNGMNPMQKLVG